MVSTFFFAVADKAGDDIFAILLLVGSVGQYHSLLFYRQNF
jgi:hypothetical protein